MKIRSLALPLAALALVPAAAQAQGFGISGRVGTLGAGLEVAAAVGERLVLRGGAGFWPDFVQPQATFDEWDVELTLPTTYNVGLDVYLNGAFRIGGGLLFRADDPELSAEATSPQEIGDTTFEPEEIGTLIGVLDSRDRAPYLLIGFGKHTDIGVGLTLDLGVAFMGEPEVGLRTEGGLLSPDQEPLRSELEREAQRFEDDMRSYLELWPILSLGLRIGV
ncbi:MAG TPA: hypothetical protein VFQ22_05445 [Longimicrobiales bacterium]|nr:hypothetical protein [Longimicrobiales bacterium]